MLIRQTSSLFTVVIFALVQTNIFNHTQTHPHLYESIAPTYTHTHIRIDGQVISSIEARQNKTQWKHICVQQTTGKEIQREREKKKEFAKWIVFSRMA